VAISLFLERELLTLILAVYVMVTLVDALSASLRRRVISQGLRGGGALKEGDELAVELGRDPHLPQSLRGVNGSLVGVDEGDARRASLEVPLEQLGLRLRKGPVDIVGQQFDAAPTLEIRRLLVHPPLRRSPAGGDP